jgi:uncharacterized protein YhdP
VGIAAADKRPGVRGFSGDLRANGSGGRIEVQSSNMLLDLPQIMDDAIDISRADGTIIWRSSNNRTTVLSDSIRIVNPVFDSRMSLHLTIDDDGSSPDIDLDGSFTVNDVGSARALHPPQDNEAEVVQLVPIGARRRVCRTRHDSSQRPPQQVSVRQQ